MEKWDQVLWISIMGLRASTGQRRMSPEDPEIQKDKAESKKQLNEDVLMPSNREKIRLSRASLCD